MEIDTHYLYLEGMPLFDTHKAFLQFFLSTDNSKAVFSINGGILLSMVNIHNDFSNRRSRFHIPVSVRQIVKVKRFSYYRFQLVLLNKDP